MKVSKSTGNHQAIVIRQSKIDAYAVKIEASWHKALESIFAVGDLINEAKKELTNEEYRTLIGSNVLPFCARVAERLAAIADDKRLRKVSLQRYLPPCWTTLDVLHRFSDDEFQNAKKQKLITPSLTREEVIALRQDLREGASKSARSKQATSTSSDPSNFVSLIFEIPAGFENSKALLDVQFLCGLAHRVFTSVTGKSKIKVSADGLKPSKKLLNSQSVLTSLIEEVRKVENHQRRQRGKKQLNEIQELLSFLGADPDDLSSNGFNLMERLAVAYARRHGVNCIKEEQLKWFASTSDTEPELLGSFMGDVKKHVASVISGKKGSRQETKIYELDKDTGRRRDEQQGLGRRA